MAKHTSRRTALKLAGGITSVAFLAGCLDDDDETDEENGDGTNGDDDENGNESEDNGDDNGEVEQDLDPAEWEDVESIKLLGDASGWVGVEPEMIADVQNPTLILFEDDEYDLTWENDDAGPHNIVVRDDNGDTVRDYGTEITRDLGDEQTLEIEATSEMSEYVCEPHSSAMVGEIQIE
ncbi:cupredoxin domain-containing protein [Halostagnicola bangensis]